jgi:hypothetical protein
MTLLFGHEAQAISCRSLAVGTRVQFQTSPFGICGGKGGIWKGFTLPPLFNHCCIFIHLSRKQR